ncbi:unnamed protein product [Caenorhabditis sp. 36 PRJEB53466]|nr:unnamed protein product [Caenorhabditis sp. 36 PRJEB53466]
MSSRTGDDGPPTLAADISRFWVAFQSRGQKDQLKKRIVEMPFVDTQFPSTTYSAATRNHLKIREFMPKDKQTYGVFVESEERKCVICHQEENEQDDELIECQGTINGASRRVCCKSKFHQTCIMKYNHGSFLFQYAAFPECQNRLLCPLHCCAACNVNHRKQSAYVGELTECAVCLRSFHSDTCVPTGAKLIAVEFPMRAGRSVNIQMMVCPAHASLKKTGSHIAACQSCEDPTDLVKCRTCVRSFHLKCRETQYIDEKDLDPSVCDFCLCDDVIRLNVPVLVRRRNGAFYLAITRPWDSYPKHQQKSASKFTTLGYTVVEWPVENAKSIVSLADISALTQSYLRTAAHNVRQTWQKTLDDFDEFEDFPSLYKEVCKNGQKSRYVCAKPQRIDRFYEVGICSCEGPDRCTTIDCPYFMCDHECPPVCAQNGRICNNRNVSDRKVHPFMERRKAGAKGFGVFATGPIKKGEFLSEYVGEIIDKREKERRMNVLSASMDFEASLYMMDLRNGLTVDAARYGNISRYMNHSCDPNAGSFSTKVFVKTDREQSVYECRTFVKAIRDIARCEEITINYGMRHASVHTCLCGAKNCSGKFERGKKDESDQSEDEEEKKEQTPRKKISPRKRKASTTLPTFDLQRAVKTKIIDDEYEKASISKPAKRGRRSLQEGKTDEKSPISKRRRSAVADPPVGSSRRSRALSEAVATPRSRAQSRARSSSRALSRAEPPAPTLCRSLRTWTPLKATSPVRVSRKRDGQRTSTHLL